MFAFALMVESGCLIPQSVDAIPDAGSAPHIVVEQLPDYMLRPSVDYYFQGPADLAESSGCHCELQLSVNVEEADPGVNLEARWFFDYSPDVKSSHVVLVAPILSNGSITGPTTRQLLPLHFDPTNDNNIKAGPHTVDVVIAAHEGFDPDTNAPLPNRSVLPGFQSTAYRMNVNVDLTPNQGTPNCPNAGASVRIGCAAK